MPGAAGLEQAEPEDRVVAASGEEPRPPGRAEVGGEVTGARPGAYRSSSTSARHSRSGSPRSYQRNRLTTTPSATVRSWVAATVTPELSVPDATLSRHRGRKGTDMPIDLVNPKGLVEPEAYVQASVATGSRTVYLAGQVAQDADGELVGVGDLAAQVAQAFRNVGTALAGVGGSMADVAKVTLYLVDWSPDKMPALREGFARVAGELGAGLRPTTLLGVAALADPRMLVEVEAVAVLP